MSDIQYSSVMKWYSEGIVRVQQGHQVMPEDLPLQLQFSFHDKTDNTRHCISLEVLNTTLDELPSEIQEALHSRRGRINLFGNLTGVRQKIIDSKELHSRIAELSSKKDEFTDEEEAEFLKLVESILDILDENKND